MAPDGTEGAGTSGWEAMAKKFRGWRMPVPPVPEVLRPAVEGRAFCFWATPAMPGTADDMYMGRMGEPEAQFAGRGGGDYVAVSHAGHGVNSYAISYHLVYRGLAVFAQEGWGGFYMDKGETTAAVADMLEGCRTLLAAWEAQGFDAQPEGRLLCIYQGSRRGGICGWVPAAPGQSLNDFSNGHRLGRDTTTRRFFDHALRLVEARAARGSNRPDGGEGPVGDGPGEGRP